MARLKRPEKDGGLGRKMDAEPLLVLPRPPPLRIEAAAKKKTKSKQRKAKRQ